MHRLGFAGEAFSDLDTTRIMAVSDTDEALLRRVHFDSQRPPPCSRTACCAFASTAISSALSSSWPEARPRLTKACRNRSCWISGKRNPRPCEWWTTGDS
ncbi:hypothetical protein QNM99_18440 [Pseudomonas sp. PCH446]